MVNLYRLVRTVIPWRNSSVECQACGYRWEAVTPGDDIPEGLQCPACLQMSGEVPTVDERAEWAGYGFQTGVND